VRLVKLVVVLIFLGAAAAIMARSPRVIEMRKQFETNRACCDLSFLQAVSLTWEEAIGGGPSYPSEIGQDKWLLVKMFPGVRDGYFLDVGSGHGTIGSNTKAAEELGWTGICVDPFPVHMEGRTCKMEKEVVSSTAGQQVTFYTHSGLGGIGDTLGKWKDEAMKAPAVQLTTTTLGEILERNQAPAYIHFISIDIEGAELEALKGIPLDRYRFGAMAIEHNEEEPKRTDIINYLKQYGYERVHSYRQDDFFAPAGKRGSPGELQ
jgi:FkbM family methyltransferase